MPTMENHKESVRKFYDAIWNNNEKSIIPELLSEDFVFRGSLGLVQRGHKGFAIYMDFVRSALANYRCEIVDMVAEGDKLYARMLYTGVHQGELFGYAPTHGKIKWDGVAVFTFENGKITELWVLGDVQNVIRQLSRYLD
ncbi:aklanonic acid methyl ester cyclase AcmA [mine drainage metagenome]|uniref:Aklanonic acid methyl ester cyclase AcmA n=1 Tax=mine drainage metagenome TaxID=410659 RepID=A0A1J5PCH4_9ZZZZ